MEIKGKVVRQLGLQNGTTAAGKAWKKGEIVVETDGQYPKKVKLSNMKDAEMLAMLPVGSRGTFYIEVESREYNGRWYTDVNCWKWEMEPGQIAPGVGIPPTAANVVDIPVMGGGQATYADLRAPVKADVEVTKAGDEDLPF